MINAGAQERAQVHTAAAQERAQERMAAAQERMKNKEVLVSLLIAFMASSAFFATFYVATSQIKETFTLASPGSDKEKAN